MATIRNAPPDGWTMACRLARLVYNGLQIEAKGRVDAGPARHPVIHSPFENGEGLVAIHTGTCILHSMLNKETKLSKYQSMDLCELGSLASDYHKDVHGFRPRGEGLYANRDALIAILEGLDAYMASRRSTFAGRECMRAEGWHVLETEPELIQQSIWLAEERDRINREENGYDAGGFWTEAMSEAAMLRRQYGMAK